MIPTRDGNTGGFFALIDAAATGDRVEQEPVTKEVLSELFAMAKEHSIGLLDDPRSRSMPEEVIPMRVARVGLGQIVWTVPVPFEQVDKTQMEHWGESRRREAQAESYVITHTFKATTVTVYGVRVWDLAAVPRVEPEHA